MYYIKRNVFYADGFITVYNSVVSHIKRDLQNLERYIKWCIILHCLKDKKHIIDMFSHTMSILYRTYQLGLWRLVDTIITRKASERKVMGA